MARASSDDLEGTVVLPGFGNERTRVEIPEILNKIRLLLKLFREYRMGENRGSVRAERFDDAITYLEKIRPIIARGEPPENIDKVPVKLTKGGTLLARLKIALKEAMTVGNDSPLVTFMLYFEREYGATRGEGDRVYSA